MYTLNNEGKLVWNAQNENNHPFESAGYLYFHKDADKSTNVVLFEAEKDGKKQYEYASMGKSDFNLIKKGDESTVLASKKSFLEKFLAHGQELPAETAAREGGEETDNVITTAPKNKTEACSIITSPHKCWCDETKEVKTQIDILPYEVTTAQFNALLSKNYTGFNRAVAAKLSMNGDKPQLMLDGQDLLAKPGMDNLRGFNKTLLKFYSPAMTSLFSNVATAPSVHLQAASGLNATGIFANPAATHAAAAAVGAAAVVGAVLYSANRK